MMTELNAHNLLHLRIAIGIARRAREHGNHPFGAILVDENDQCLLEAENNVITAKDCTGHAETNLVRLASQKFSEEQLARCTLYTSTEPCPMCCGAIYWSKIGRVVFALSAASLYARTENAADKKLPPGQTILSAGGIQITGPMIEDEAFKVHEGFWK